MTWAVFQTTATKANGKGTGVVGDDGAPCRNGWQAYGVYMTGGGESPPPATTMAATTTAATTTAATPANATVRPKTPSARNTSKRQAVFDSDGDDPATAAPPKPFQWFSKTFAFLKRMFTFVIIPFFKFVRNTFFQTRSVDDTVVDVSETHLTVSDEKYDPPTPTAATAADVASTTVAAAAASTDFAGADDDDNDVDKRQSSASKRETDVGVGGGGQDRCGAAAADRLTAADLVSADAVAAAADGAKATAGRELSPNARRYLRLVTDGLNDVGVDAAFVRRAYACCARPFESGRSAAATLDWDRNRAVAHNVTVTPHVCGRQR